MDLTSNSYVSTNEKERSIFHVSVNTLPTSSLIIALTAYHCGSMVDVFDVNGTLVGQVFQIGDKVDNFMRPDSFYITRESLSLDQKFEIIYKQEGCYTVNATKLDTSPDDTYYKHVEVDIYIQSDTTPPSPPVLLTATFGMQGLQMYFQFDSAGA